MMHNGDSVCIIFRMVGGTQVSSTTGGVLAYREGGLNRGDGCCYAWRLKGAGHFGL